MQKNPNARDLDRKEKISQLKVVLNSDSPSSRMEGKFYNWAEIFSKDAPLALPCLLFDGDSKEQNERYHMVEFACRSASIFKSATSPLLIPFIAADGEQRNFIFKCGDDLRQDRNVVLMFKVMDYIWKSQGINFFMDETLYEVIPTGPTSGLMQMVPKCYPLSCVESFTEFFAKHKTANMKTYVHTLAAYSVATFLLGIGDRHLDNLLITERGHLFHIDFGFIFGDDPKPSFTVAPMRVNKNMIAHIPNIEELYSKIGSAFNIMRLYATVLLDITFVLFGEKGYRYLTERLRLDLDDETASLWIRGKVQESIRSVLPSINESIHKIAQYIRD